MPSLDSSSVTQPPPDRHSVFGAVASFAASMAKFAASGFKTVDQSLHQLRMSRCEPCEYRPGGMVFHVLKALPPGLPLLLLLCGFSPAPPPQRVEASAAAVGRSRIQPSPSHRPGGCASEPWRRGQAPFAGQRPEGCFARMVSVPLSLPETRAAHARRHILPPLGGSPIVERRKGGRWRAEGGRALAEPAAPCGGQWKVPPHSSFIPPPGPCFRTETRPAAYK
jgi:hypothetical protein